MAHEPDNKGEIVLYQPDDLHRIEVLVESETVWLSQAQMAELFETTKQNISMHINNIFKEGELDADSIVKEYLTVASDGKKYHIIYYNLDVIISVGYRVRSKRGTQFRIWSNRVLKEYILRGYAINQRFEQIEYRVAETEKKIEFFINTAAPPVQGVFSEGQIFDAYAFVSDLIRSAKRSVVVIDNYADETVLLLLSKRLQGVVAEIYTRQISRQLKLDLDKHNGQYPPVKILESDRFHDRFLLIDGTVYHVGSSFKDLGKKLFAFSKMEIDADVILEGIQ